MTPDVASNSFVHAEQANIEIVDAGIRRQILGFGSDLMTCRVWFERGAVGALHSHPHSQTTYVESGRFLFEVGDDRVELVAGDCAYIAPNQLHGATCLEAGILLDNFSPMRGDFLEPEQIS